MKKFSKVLVPTDFSDESNRALEYALFFGAAMDIKVLVLHVADSRALNAIQMSYGDLADSFIDDHSFEDMAQEIKNAMKQSIKDGINFEHNVEVTMHVREGIPYDQIIKFAAEKEVDFICIGAMGHTALEDMMMGSVSSKVARRAACPVFLVR